MARRLRLGAARGVSFSNTRSVFWRLGVLARTSIKMTRVCLHVLFNRHDMCTSEACIRNTFRKRLAQTDGQ